MANTEAFAPAKINLTLHVTGQRSDGYHLLDSLVVFADFGDRLTVRKAKDLTLQITGPMAAGLSSGEDNLVLRAARLAGVTDAAITLDKQLPAAAGIGGGSADAAATLRALRVSHGAEFPRQEDLLELGADVPICLRAKSLRMRGIGERIEVVPTLPALPAVLLNPGVPVHTPAAFRALTSKNGSPMPDVPVFSGVAGCVDWLAHCRNDLQAPALGLCSQIGDCLEALSDQNALLTRMSGSGATCFGIFETIEAAERAGKALKESHSQWWVKAVTLGNAP